MCHNIANKYMQPHGVMQKKCELYNKYYIILAIINYYNNIFIACIYLPGAFGTRQVVTTCV